MLTSTPKKIQLQREIQKIICFSNAFNDTFVFSYVISPGREEGIIHMDAKGVFIFEHRYQDMINYFQMLSDREIIVLDVPNSHIDIINL
jgi:hypothetical protein